MENNNENKITIVDINIPFMSLVFFMVKAAIASIPAGIILLIISTLFMGIFGGIFGGLIKFFH